MEKAVAVAKAMQGFAKSYKTWFAARRANAGASRAVVVGVTKGLEALQAVASDLPPWAKLTS
eukprot:13848069-Alexandrium_andersonii.AAC.1